MSRSRKSALAALLTLVALIAIALQWRGGDDGPTAPAEVDVAEREPAALTLRPSPTPTAPPPWLDSTVAVSVPDERGAAIALLAVDGRTAPRRLIDGFVEIGHLAWSPSGDALAFAAKRDGNWDLYRVRRDGAGLQRLTDHPAYDAWPTWSPDGAELAFVSYRDGGLDIYRVPVDMPEREVRSGAATDVAPTDGPTRDADVTRLTAGGGPAIEPAWSPDGAWIAFASWHAGAYRLEAVSPTGDGRHVVAQSDGGIDLRAPGWTPDGAQLTHLRSHYGTGQVVARLWSPDDDVDRGDDGRSGASAVRAGAGTQRGSTVAVRAEAYSWFPGGGAVAYMDASRWSRRIELRSVARFGRRTAVRLPDGAEHVSWTDGPLPTELALAELDIDPLDDTDRWSEPEFAAPEERPGLVRLSGIDVSGPRINAALADDFAALREEVRAATGRDFLGVLSDLWRPIGFDNDRSAFFSWHKTGRAFDTQMELRGPGGRRDMVLVREEVGSRTMWRMFLRAGVQDGSIGRPLTQPGWTFAAGGGFGDPAVERAGGERGGLVPGGYWLDFTALAERYGWHRIPSLERGRSNWRSSWAAIEYWHYERRDGLRWFEAMRQVYSDRELAAELTAERIRSLDVWYGRLARLGIPPGWPEEG